MENETFYCPSCGRALNSARDTVGNEIEPSDKDISLCVNCGEILMYSTSRDILISKASSYELEMLMKEQPGLYMMLLSMSLNIKYHYTNN